VVRPLAVEIGSPDLALSLPHRLLTLTGRRGADTERFRGSLLLPLRCPLGMGEERKI